MWTGVLNMEILNRGPMDPRWQPPPGPPELDPVAASAWLGIRFGVLRLPAHRMRYLAQHFSDSGHGRTADGRDAPVSITIRHHIDDDLVVDVVTRRDYEDSTVLDHMWQAVTDYRLADPPEGGDVGAWAHQYAVRPRPPEEASQPLALDGALIPWRRFNDDQLVVVGTAIAGGFVAIAGPAELADGFAVELLPQVS